MKSKIYVSWSLAKCMSSHWCCHDVPLHAVDSNHSAEKEGFHECRAKAVVRLEPTPPLVLNLIRCLNQEAFTRGTVHWKLAHFPKEDSLETQKEGYRKWGCNSVPTPSVFADQTPFYAANDPKICQNFPSFQNHLFLLSGFSRQSPEQKRHYFSIRCRLVPRGRGSGAPIQIKHACLRSKAGAFEFLPCLCQVLAYGHNYV